LGATGLFASNGVPIPDPPPTDPCEPLELAAKSCAPWDDCLPLTCDCDGAPFKVPALDHDSCRLTERCLVGVSCPAICAKRMAVVELTTEIFVCFFNGSCRSNADCAAPAKPHCLLPLAGWTGHCTSRQAGDDCYSDADCAGVCVARAGGGRWCQDRSSGSPCNRHDQCRPHDITGVATCILPDGGYAGVCSDGTNGGRCATSEQCLPGYACVQTYEPVCSSRSKGAPCAVDADCSHGYCVGYPGSMGTCDNGEAGDSCVEPGDCRVPACSLAGKCTGGGNRAPCTQDSQCASQRCTLNTAPDVFGGECTDGKAGSPCRDNAHCNAGLPCRGGTCIEPQGLGASCEQDVQCLTGKCAGALVPVSGVCTSGERGQRCSGTAQCAPGLHCVRLDRPPPLGVCVAGAAGDPCLTGADCNSGTCLNPGGENLPGCYPAADLTSCANGQGACVTGACLHVCL
jgi:hypothetical protein